MAKTEQVRTIKRSDVPRDFPVRPLRPSDKAEDRATCGTCGLSWDDAIPTSMTPAPAARCPFEAFHVYDAVPDEQVEREPLKDHRRQLGQFPCANYERDKYSSEDFCLCGFHLGDHKFGAPEQQVTPNLVTLTNMVALVLTQSAHANLSNATSALLAQRIVKDCFEETFSSHAELKARNERLEIACKGLREQIGANERLHVEKNDAIAELKARVAQLEDVLKDCVESLLRSLDDRERLAAWLTALLLKIKE